MSLYATPDCRSYLKEKSLNCLVFILRVLLLCVDAHGADTIKGCKCSQEDKKCTVVSSWPHLQISTVSYSLIINVPILDEY